MNKIQKSHETKTAFLEKYQGRCMGYISTIQVALLIIFATGVALASLGYFGYLKYNFSYAGIGGSVASLIVIMILQCSQKNNLRPALEEVKSFAELESVLDSAEVKHPCCSWSYCVGTTTSLEIFSNKLGGGVSSRELHDKIEQMLEHPKSPLDINEQRAARKVTDYLVKQYNNLNSNEDGFIPNLDKYIK